jgi:hypothetical protein
MSNASEAVAMYAAECAQLRAEVEKLQGAIRADEERSTRAAERVGAIPFGCDTADHLAELVLELRAQLAAERQRSEQLQGDKERLEWERDEARMMSALYALGSIGDECKVGDWKQRAKELLAAEQRVDCLHAFRRQIIEAIPVSTDQTWDDSELVELIRAMRVNLEAERQRAERAEGSVVHEINRILAKRGKAASEAIEAALNEYERSGDASREGRGAARLARAIQRSVVEALRLLPSPRKDGGQ